MSNNISIIIPTYKPSELFFDCLKSISLQEWAPYELIIVLNGCREPYYSTIEKWLIELNLSKNTKLIQVNEGGVSNARNIGLENASGNYIVFIDDDDLISKNFLRELYSNRGDDETLVVSNVELIGHHRSYAPSNCYKVISSEGFHSLFSARKLLNAPWMKLFPRSMIGKIRFNEKFSLGEDALFAFQLSKNIKSIKTTSETAIYFYRLREGGISWKNKKVKELTYHMFALIKVYSSIFFSEPLNYSCSLYLSRIAATLINFSKAIIKHVR